MIMMMKENYKIEKYQDSSFQNFSSRIVFFLNVFDYSKTFFQNLVRRGVRGGAGWCRNMKVQIKNSKLKFKVFFKVLKFLSLFSHKNAFKKNILRSCGGGMGEGWGRGGDGTCRPLGLVLANLPGSC
jgi:hypothetical protein